MQGAAGRALARGEFRRSIQSVIIRFSRLIEVAECPQEQIRGTEVCGIEAFPKCIPQWLQESGGFSRPPLLHQETGQVDR